MLLLLALGGVLLSAGWASASPAHVDHQAWTRTGVLGPADAQDDRLYVSTTGGQEQARAFIALTAAQLTVTQLHAGSLVLVEGDGGVFADRGQLVACALLTSLAADGELEGRPPEVDCDESAEASRASDGVWDVPLQAFADSLADGRTKGVALLAAASEVTSPAFTVVLDPARTEVLVPTRRADVGPGQSGTSDKGQASTEPGESTSSDFLLTGAPAMPSAFGTAEELPSLASSFDSPALAPESSQAPAPSVAADGGQLPSSARLTSAAIAPAQATSARSLLIIALVVGVAALAILARTRVVVPAVGLPAGRVLPSLTLGLPRRAPRRMAVWLVVPALVMLLPETAAYKIGIIAIVFVGAIGLHLLVNVAGELSLAHAAFVGIPAFAVAHASARGDLSPILAVPVGVLAGVAIGLVVAMTALRARGLQVALVTLAVAIATVQFLFYREWVIGPPEGLAVPVPSLFGMEFASNVARVPVLTALVALAALAGTAIIRSKLGRGLSLVRTNPDVAAAAGIPVSLYRAMAYAIAGGFAGLAGACYVIWVQLVSPQAFPLQLGFTYLLIAALAGRGGLGGVAVSAVIVQGGALFTFLPQNVTLYLAPVALLLQVTRFEGGINASLRALPVLLANKKRSRRMTAQTSGEGTAPGSTLIRLPVALGLLMVIAGFTAIAVAWYNTGRTNQLWIQNQEIVSGGMIGLGLIVFGSTLLLRDALLHGGGPVRERVLVEPRLLVDPRMLPLQPSFEREVLGAVQPRATPDASVLEDRGEDERVAAAPAGRKRR